MKYLSVCSGIESATVAWEPLGWECVGLCDFASFPQKVLSHHYPNTTLFTDITKLTQHEKYKKINSAKRIIFKNRGKKQCKKR
jgi:DNA (cytosine-5)-methyltransferase 1